MNNTALGAESIIFISEAHEKFYYEKLKEVRYQDVYHRALCYCLGINDDTRRNANRIYDFKTGWVKTECLQEGWQTSGSVKVVRMAFNLYCNSTPSSLNHSVGDQVQVSCNGIVRDFTVLAHVVANEANTYDWVGSCFFLPSEVYEDFTCNNYVMSYSFDVSQGKGPEMDAFLDEYTKNVEPTMTYKSKSTIMAGVTDIQNMVVSIGGTMAFIIELTVLTPV